MHEISIISKFKIDSFTKKKCGAGGIPYHQF